MSIFENFGFCIDCNFCAKCPFSLVLGLFESLDIDLSNGTGPIKKYSLSSEIQLLEVGHISENIEKTSDPSTGFGGFELQKCSPKAGRR